MKIKIDAQLRTLAALKDRVRDQVTEMQRLEVRLRLTPNPNREGKKCIFLLQYKQEMLYL